MIELTDKAKSDQLSNISLKGWLISISLFLMLVSVYVMLLFEHKQNLQRCSADSSVQTEISSVKNLSV